MKSCIIYTVKNEQGHLNKLSKSLKLVYVNLIQPLGLEIDLVFFNDEGIDDKVYAIKEMHGIENNFICNRFNIRQPAYSSMIQARIVGQIEYKNMCRFWAGEVFRDKNVGAYDYYMRLDCDSYITDKVPYDPFKMIDNEGKFYAYLRGGVFQDSPHVMVDFRKTLLEFENSTKDRIFKSCMEFPEGSLYYTNFEIANVSAFKESGYMKLYDYIDRTGGIYMHRWGDAIIRYAGINMLMGETGVKEISDIKYTHQHFINGVFK